MNYKRFSLLCVLVLFISFFQPVTISAQIILTQNFESATFPPSGWTLINGTSGSDWSLNTNPANSVSGTNSAQVLQGASTPSAWLITPGISLQAGAKYRISYWFKSVGSTPKRLKLSAGTGPTLNDQLTLINNRLVPNTSYAEGQDIYYAPTTGTYYFGFNGTYIWSASAGNLYMDSIVIQREVTPDCAGTPVVGIASGSPYYCTGVPVKVTLSGDYSANGTSLQWYSSPAGAGTFTPIPGATGLVLSAVQSAPTDYHCVVTCSISGLSAVSNVVSVTIPTLCYCTPPVGNCSFNDLINQVVFAGINNITSCSQPPAYADYFATIAPANVTAGDVVPITVNVGSGGAEYVSVWIDYNRNGVFEASEYNFLGFGMSIAINGTITIPSTAAGGLTRMRVRAQKGAAIPAANACAGVQFGETEDYAVMITALPNCTGTPNGGTTQSSAAAVCSGVNFTLSLSGASNNPGITYQWQSSPNNTNWTDISGAASSTLITQQTTATYYRCKVTCTNSGQQSFSTSLQVTMKICYCTPAVVSCSSNGIDSVGFSNLGNISGCSANGYADYTSSVSPAVITAGTYVKLWVKVNSPSVPRYAAAWIDFNQDGIFSPSEFFDINVSSGVYNTRQIRIPFTALTGITTMRVQSSYTGISTFGNGCGGFSTGETEDYAVNILPNTSGNTAFSYFVNPNASTGGNGLSWASAFTTLTEALNNAGKKDTIRVAKGLYKAQYTLKDSVMILGGYPDTGNPTDAARDWGANPTRLSAEAGDPNFYWDNRSNVLDGFGLSANTVVDGFILESAYRSNGSVGGGGINLSNSSARINNCVIRNNYSFNSHPGGSGGSAIMCAGGSPMFTNCFITGNNDLSYGPVHLKQNATAGFVNCVFTRNTGPNTFYSNQATATLKYCTVFGNQSQVNGFGDTLRLSALLADNVSVISIANSIFFHNINKGNVLNEGSADTTDFVLRSGSLISITKTITQAYNTGEPAFVSANPKFRDTANITGPDGLYYTADDGLQLANPCSPAINTGDNAAGSSVITDIRGNPRIAGTITDQGAYEEQAPQSAIAGVVYVKSGATGANDGSSWTNAFTSLQTALQSCSDTIRVAAGSYTASAGDKNASFWLENKRVILGGYPNTGNPADADRDPVANPTILTAILPVGGGVRTEIIVRGKNLDSTAVLDGFVISDVKDSITTSAAMVLTVNGSPVIRNTIFRNNISGYYSAALITKTASKPLFYNCTFENNGGFTTTGSNSGAVYNMSGASPVFRKCIFRNNSTRIENVSPYSGGAVTNNNANPVFDSCTFTKNTANNWGGAIANFNSSPLITNSGFFGNTAYTAGADIYNDASSPVVTKCLFADSTVSERGGSIYNINQSNPQFTDCQFRNSKASSEGGAVYNDHSSPVFNRCVFTGSNTVYGTGVIYNRNFSKPVFANCVFANNMQTGGADNLIYNVKSMPVLLNSTFVNNKPPYLFSGSQSGLIMNTDSTTLTVKNCIFWGNDTKVGSNIPDGDIVEIFGSTTPSIITNSFTRSTGINGVNGNFVGIDPRLVDITNPAGPDGVFYTADDGIALCTCSPAVNSGTNAAIAGYTTDFANNPRIVGSNTDIGAVELQTTTLTAPKGVYVNASAAGANNGSSWANAYTSLQKAMQNSCADTIRVSKGTYKPALINRDSTFYVNRRLFIWGGYPDTGNPPDSVRNPDLYPSILSGDIGVTSDSTDNTYVLMRIHNDDTTVVIDGLTFARGNAVQSYFLGDKGAGIHATNNKNLLVRNCRFENNYALWGSALYSSDKITVDGCVFRQNNSIWGTVRLEGINAVVKNTVFIENNAQTGGGVHCAADARFENVVFYKNKAYVAGGAYLDGNPKARFVNCDFVRNNALTTHVGVGLYNYNTYLVLTPNPVIRNCVFYENAYNNAVTNLVHSDWAWVSGSYGLNSDPLDIKHTALITNVPYATTNIGSAELQFRDVNNPAGPDGIWFTADDGLQWDRCSRAINNGDNNEVISIPLDINRNPRIRNITVDMGAYEYQPTTPDNLLTNPNDSLVADIERTDSNGWTHYYKGCQLLLSLKKGNRYIGFVADGTFRLVVKTTPAYASGAATNLSAAAYVSPGINWYTMNRYWTLRPTAQITDSILVRFPFTNSDFNDVRGSNPLLTNIQQLVMYTVDTPYTPQALSVPVDKFRPGYNGTTPSTTVWKYVVSDTINYAEYYVKTLSGGGGGSGTGINGGPLLRISGGCTNGARTLVSPETGSTYQWQVNTGSGYTNITDDAVYSGTASVALTISNPPTSWYGRLYRCVVNGVPSSSYFMLLFQNNWTGAADTAWENPLNWSCGQVPDANTDVVINSGSIVVNSGVIINSLRLNPGVNITVSTGNSITVLHQ